MFYYNLLQLGQRSSLQKQGKPPFLMTLLISQQWQKCPRKELLRWLSRTWHREP